MHGRYFWTHRHSLLDAYKQIEKQLALLFAICYMCDTFIALQDDCFQCNSRNIGGLLCIGLQYAPRWRYWFLGNLHIDKQKCTTEYTSITRTLREI